MTRSLPALRYAASRLAFLLLALVAASTLVFMILRLLPGDSAGTTLGVGTTAEQLDLMRAQLGTDQPLLSQYTAWIRDLFTGQTESFISRRPFAEVVGPKVAITVPLSLFAFALAVLISIPLGLLAAMYRHTIVGVLISAFTQVGIAVPIFWVGVMLVWGVSLEAQLLPAGGFPRRGWDEPGAAMAALTLPAITIAIAMSAVMIRYIRSAVIDVLEADYMRTARSLGYGRFQAFRRHGLRNAAVPVVAILGIELATSLLGAVVIENVFALPGLGTWLLDSVQARDLPIVQNLVVILTAVVLVVNFLIDLLQRAIDPRLQLASVGQVQ